MNTWKGGKFSAIVEEEVEEDEIAIQQQSVWGAGWPSDTQVRQDEEEDNDECVDNNERSGKR